MNTRQLFRNFATPAYCFSLVTLVVACSGSEEPSNPGSGGSGASGSSSTSGGSGTSGSGTSGSGTSGSGTSGSGNSGSMEVVGSFQVTVVADQEMPDTGATTVIGKVNDGPSPAGVRWDVTVEDGDCRVEEPRAPFCEGGCMGDVCVDDGVCKPFPAGKVVGEVTLKGVALDGGASEIVLKEIAKSYQPPAGTVFAYPPFAEGDPVTIEATGGDYSPFELSSEGVAPVAFTSTDFELDVDKPLVLTWDAATDPESSQVHVKLDISHHGGSRGQIICETDDTGMLTISGDLMTELIGLGVAGFPSIILTRMTQGSAAIEPGLVELVVSSKVERFVTVAGVESCTEDEDCSDGKTCQPDLTCM